MPALGKDLSKIRSHLGLSIQDIQHYTKIPVSTLQSIENGSIFAHPEENQTYIRSFARSYARALKIDDDVMIKALDQNEAGNYNHLLLEQYPELQPDQLDEDEQKTEPESEEEPEKEETSESVESGLFDQPKAEEIEKESEDDDSTEIERIELVTDKEESSDDEEPEIPKTATSPVAEESKPRTTETEKSVKSVDWADVGRKFNQEKKRTPVWIIGLIIILIVAAFMGYFLYENGFLGFQDLIPEQQEEVTPQSETSQSSLSLDLEDSLAASDAGNQPEMGGQSASELGDVLELTVYAAYGDLGPVRVWTDLKPRMDPYWLEEGTAMHFEFEDTIRVRGPYPDLLLLKDGHLVENAAQEFLQQNEDYIQITRDFFASDSKWTTSIDYQLPEGVQPPDSIANRPTF